MDVLFGGSREASLGKKTPRVDTKKRLIKDFDKADQLEVKVE